MIIVSTTPVLAKSNIQIRIIRIYRASQSASLRLIHYTFSYISKNWYKISYYSNNRKLVATPGEQVGNECFWGYFWGYSVTGCTIIPFKINRLRHLFDCLLGNPYCKACWQWCVQQHSPGVAAIIGSNSTRQGGVWISWLAGLLACWHVCSLQKPARPCLHCWQIFQDSGRGWACGQRTR